MKKIRIDVDISDLSCYNTARARETETSARRGRKAREDTKEYSGHEEEGPEAKKVKEAIPLYHKEVGSEHIACLVRFIDT